MVQGVEFISAEELFGAASRLVVEGENIGLTGIASLGSMYQLATGVVALLFIFISVRYSDAILNLVFSLFSRRISRSDSHIYSGEINNIELFTSLAGVLLIALFVMRLSVEPKAMVYLSPLLSHSSWGIGGIVLGGSLALILGERIMLYALGFVSENMAFSNTLWHSKTLHFSATALLISPMLILSLLTDGDIGRVALLTSATVCSISLILFVKETFSLFRSQRFSIFHWILYLCALEIFPLSLLLAPIARG